MPSNAATPTSKPCCASMARRADTRPFHPHAAVPTRMPSMFRSHPLSLAVLLAVAPLSASAAERADLLIRNATVVDVEHARSVPGQSVVIRGEDIVAVGPDAQLRSQWSASRQ